MGPCPNHPASPAIGACVECERRGCSACLRPSHGELRCVGRCLSHPGSEVASTPAPHVTDKSDVILPAWLSEEEKSNTSILEMSPLKPSPPGSPDGSGLAPEAQPSPESSLDDPGGEISAPPPADEGSIVLVLPDTRRETIQHPCFRHPETPAVVVCGRCARPICSICGADSPEGFACASVCTIQPRRRPVLPVALGALGLAAVIIGGIVLYRWVVPGDSPGLRPSIPAGGERSGPPELAVSPAKPAPLEPPKLEPRPLVSKTPDPAAPPSEPKAEPKPEIRPTAKVDAPPDSKPEPRPEPKPEPKTPVPTAPPVAPAPRPAAPPRPEPKPEVRPAPAAPEPARASPPKPERPTPGPSPQLSPLAQAAGLIRQSTPVFSDVAEVIDEPVLRQIDRSAMLDRLQTVRHNLEEARALYTEARGGAADPAALDRRIGILGHVLDAVPVVEERIQRSESLEKAAQRIREATRLGREVTDAATAPPSEEIDRQALRVKAALVREKLREARSIYAALRGRTEDPDLIDSRIQKIDRILKIFEGR